MNRERHVPLIVFLCVLACSSSGVQRSSPTLLLRYSVKNALHNSETRIELVDDSLSVYHKPGLPGDGVDERFAIDTSERNRVSRLLRDIRFHDIPQPRQERMLDAPDESLTAVYDGRSSTISLGAVPHLPEEIVRLRTMLLDLATTHSARLKSALGY